MLTEAPSRNSLANVARHTAGYVLRRILRRHGYELRRPDEDVAHDFDARVRRVIERVAPFTLTTPARIASLCAAVEYVSKRGIPGAIVECGVWRGGSMMAVALTLLEVGVQDRDLYLFDTFEGMPPPTQFDLRRGDGAGAAELLSARGPDEKGNIWCMAKVDEVRAHLASTGYPEERIHFVQGMVEDTLPSCAPPSVSIMRLDTDWYESTLHELKTMYPLLNRGGFLILDDYGEWEGARRAVEEYFEELEKVPFLARVDFGCRIAIRP